MNKFINVLLLFILFPTILLTVFVGFDLPLSFLRTTGQMLPYKFEIFLGIGLVFFVILLKRSIRRWMGMLIISKQKRFKWNAPVSQSRKKRVITYLGLETFIMFFIGVALYMVSEEAFAPAAALVFSAVDNLLFAVIGIKINGFRVGLSSKALMVADREVVLLYFNGLRKVSVHQQSIYFDYIKELQLSFPLDCIQEEQRKEFFQILEAQLNPKKVYFEVKK